MAQKKPRSAERAKAVMDRASRMQAFRPALGERRIGDTQLRTPNKNAKNLDLSAIPKDQLKKVGKSSIDIKTLVTDQPTVSLKAVKAKIDEMEKGTFKSKVVVIQGANGKNVLYDGNHSVTAARAKGMTHIDAHVFQVDKAGNLVQAKPAAPKAPAGKAIKVGAKAALAIAAAAAVTAAFAGNAKADDGKDQKDRHTDPEPTNGTIQGLGFLKTAAAAALGVAGSIALKNPNLAVKALGIASSGGAMVAGSAKAQAPEKPKSNIESLVQNMHQIDRAPHGKETISGQAAKAGVTKPSAKPSGSTKQAKVAPDVSKSTYTKKNGEPGKKQFTAKQIASFKARQKSTGVA